MAENEAIKRIKECRNTPSFQPYIYMNEALDMAIKALEKQIPKKPIEKEMPYSEEVGHNSEWQCPICGAYIGYFTEGMEEPEQMEYCNECGQHIARDWSE